MLVSDITSGDLMSYCRIAEPTTEDRAFFEKALEVAKQFIQNYTGLSQDEIDKHFDFVICVYVLCQDMYDNRALYVDKSNLNTTVDTILGFHRVNLL